MKIKEISVLLQPLVQKVLLLGQKKSSMYVVQGQWNV